MMKREKPYAYRKENGVSIMLHRFLLGLGPGDPPVDHIDGNANLSLCTVAENNQIMKAYATNQCGYKGVGKKYLPKNKKSLTRPWYARIMIDQKQICLGYFVSAEEAALAYNDAARRYHGEFAFQNEVTNE